MIFDKSLLETLSPDEAVWLGQFYNVNMTPLFLVETLADLKTVEEGRTPERVVSRLAEKTSVMGADANVHHAKLCAADVLGHEVEMQGFVVLEGGRPIARGGKERVIFKLSDEAEALGRWCSGKFPEAERDYAKAWRASLDELDLRRNL